ncbi:hypothetical protein [Nitrosomonas sp.]|uniref:hypothetical protein n=1 Tax=Nitrosomonas sp. TaxID=42353 RepID=UPI0025E09722|nr:hypothetical protein [Nitrosomonas sp.]
MTERVIMKINSNFKKNNFTILFTRTCLILFLNVLVLPLVHAENISNLQKNASIAYDKMMQAKQSADTLNKDAVFAEKTLAAIKQKLATAEQEAETARKKSEQARISMEQAINQWKQASDALANEWGKTDRK